MKDDTVEAVKVSAGRKIGDNVEVTGALKSGDKLVLSPPDKLEAGMTDRGGRQVTAPTRAGEPAPSPIIRIRGLDKAYQRGEQTHPGARRPGPRRADEASSSR